MRPGHGCGPRPEPCPRETKVHRDPTRRNRNIGTAKQGHRRQSENKVPRRWADTIFQWNRDVESQVVERTVHGRCLPIRVERTRPDCFHACTPDDVAQLLNLLPEALVSASELLPRIDGVVLRQATRKEDRSSPAWARLGHLDEIRGELGEVLILDAQVLPLIVEFGKSLGPEAQRWFRERRQVATRHETTRRSHRLHFDLEAVRRMQLYHSIPHEYGHWLDAFTTVYRPALVEDEDFDELWKRYWSRSTEERERFADEVSLGLREELETAGTIPFDRRLDPESLTAEGLQLDDFVPPPTEQGNQP